jgi:Transglycosylase-like domain
LLTVTASSVSALSALATHASAASAALPTGIDKVLNAPIVSLTSTPDGLGYWETASDGGVFTFGDAPFYGAAASLRLNEPIVGMASSSADGYWEVASDGGIFTYGNAPFYGSAGAAHLNRPVVGMEPTPDGKGYWLVASDGGIFTYGDAHFYGSASGLSPGSAIVSMSSTPDGGGYWLASANGAVFAFGDAAYKGGASVGPQVIGISSTSTGYRLGTATGSIYAFGGSSVFGSMADQHLNQPVVGIQQTPDGMGYWLVAADGGVFAFGDAFFYGSLGGSTLSSSHASAAITSGDGVTAAQIAAWDKVNICEEDGLWNVDGPVYSGGLGFSHANWTTFNTFGYPADAANATPDEQIRVAVAFATAYLGGPNAAPDQNGCTGGY